MKILFYILIFQLFLFEKVYANYAINVDFFNRFNDCYFVEYIKEALENNHDLKQANQKVLQYRFEISNQFSKELPSLSVGSNYLGNHFPTGDTNFLIKRNSYILPFLVNFEPDLLLKNKDKTKSAKKLFEAQLANQKGTYISLLSDVSNAYINILLFDYLLEIQKDILKDEKANVNYASNKYKAGIIDYIELHDSISSLKTQETLFENFQKNLKTALFNFSVLIGRSPECFKDIKRGKLSEFEYQNIIPDEISSDVIFQRPDIIEIENKIKSAKIDITVAKKDFFPTFKIIGALVFDTAGGGNFFSWDSTFAYLLAGLTQDIFKGGAKIANLKIKKAKFQELIEEYKQKDLIALKEIKNALNLIKHDKITELNSKKQLELEENNERKSFKKLDRGIISNVDYLHDRNALNQRKQLFATSKAQRLMDYITLYKAIGGEL